MLSIIIPVYNVENYLHECLNSVVNQTYRDIEIIIVNDGSTDNSKVIIEDFRKKDNRIIFIDQDNQGLAAARNAGVEIASGEYIAFLDSDDWINVKMYEKMISRMQEEKADIVACGVEDRYKNKSVPSLILKDEVINNIQENKDTFFNDHVLKEGVVVWNKIYRSEIIKRKKIKFIGKSHILQEDILFNFQYYLEVNTAVNIADIFVNYRIRSSSITKTSMSNIIEKNLRLIEYMHEYILNTNSIGQLDKYFSRMAYNMCNIATYHTENDSISEIKKVYIKSSSNQFFNSAFPVNLLSLHPTSLYKYFIDKQIYKKAYGFAALLQWMRVKTFKFRTNKTEINNYYD